MGLRLNDFSCVKGIAVKLPFQVAAIARAKLRGQPDVFLPDAAVFPAQPSGSGVCNSPDVWCACLPPGLPPIYACCATNTCHSDPNDHTICLCDG
jgi:hypothetical protein